MPIYFWYVCGVALLGIAAYVAYLLNDYRLWTKPGALAVTVHTATGDRYNARVFCKESEGGLEMFELNGRHYVSPIQRPPEDLILATVPEEIKKTNDDAKIATWRNEQKTKLQAWYTEHKNPPIHRERVTFFLTVNGATYREGWADAINIDDIQASLPVDLVDKMGYHHIISDTLKTLASEVLNPLLIAGAAVVVILAGTWFINSDTKSKVEALAQIQAANGSLTDNPPVP